MQSVALAIPHCSWDPTRVATLDRLLTQLGTDSNSVATVVQGTGPEPSRVWFGKMTEWAVTTGADRFLTIQDDARVCLDFWRTFRAMTEAVPDQVIGLQAIHPYAPHFAERGRWYTTSDMLAGVSWTMPMATLREMMRFEATSLRPGFETRLNEDNRVAMFCAMTGRKIWHPMPTLVDHHDPTEKIRSNYGHDAHGNRNSTVTWHQLEPKADVEFWKPGVVPHFGRFYQHTPAHVARNVKDWSESDMARIEGDVVKFRRTP